MPVYFVVKGPFADVNLMALRYKCKGWGEDLIMVVCHLMTGICSVKRGRQFVIQISECTYTTLDSCDTMRQYNLMRLLPHVVSVTEQNVLLWGNTA